MAHSFACPSCNITTRVSDELFLRKVSGRRVKITCKGCRKPMVVDATTSELRISALASSQADEHQSSAAQATVHVPAQLSIQARPQPRPQPRPEAPRRRSEAPAPATLSLAPIPRARALMEEELPTLRRNEIPVDESFLPPAAASDPPPTSWPATLPPLDSPEALAALLTPTPTRRRRARVAVLTIAALCMASAGAWATRDHTPLGSWLGDGGRGSALKTQASMQPRPVESVVRNVESVAGNEVSLADRSSPDLVVAPPAAGPPPVDSSAVDSSAPSTPTGVVSAAAEVSPPGAAPRAREEATLPSRSASAEPALPGMASPVSASAEPASPGLGRENGSVQTSKDSHNKADDADDEPAFAPTLQPFDRAAAAAALQVAESQLAACRQAGDPSGTARVVVTFAPSGRVTSALVSGPPFAGTPAGGCIAGRFRAAQVPQFEGNFVTVTKTVVLQ